ncbi:hypothetical protein Tco_1044709 [Tanacetum coccineum]|uniref:Integrase, catalytic region, zinc finger, CCHC-type, peptidase aspartic, catalytic n=1 Tax=Tanacetum coccineum TaxID=301880 RepID=A0ABQ5GRS3_9ASTR
MIVNSSVDNASVNVHSLKLKTELFNKKDFVEKEIYDKLFKSFTTLEKHRISLEVDTQLNQENFQSLKERLKSLRGKINEYKIRKGLRRKDETINIELDHTVSKLIAENEHLKQTYKQLYDSIKPARIRSKEQCNDLINQVNLKSAEISNLKASLQEKVLVITSLKNDLRKLKGKALVDPSDPEMLKIDMEPITPKLLNKRTAHSAYIKHTQEEAVVLRGLVDHVKENYPLDHTLDYVCRYTKLIQELLTNTGNTKKDKIQQTPSSTQKNKVETHPRKVKSSLKNKDYVVAPKETAKVQHSKLNANSELKCVKCKGCMLFDNHDLCVLDFINNVNARNKSKSVKKISKRKVWKPTGKVFINIRYIWRPTGRTFIIAGNAYPLTRITTSTEVPLRKPTALDNEAPKPVVTLVYSRKPRKSKTNESVSKSKVASDDLRDALSVIFGLSEIKEITSDEEVEGPMKDQPLSADASPTALSPGYIANSDPEEDKEDPEEDPADHPADG